MTERILQLVHGLLVDGSHAVVHKGAAQEDCQGKDPGVVLVVTLKMRAHWGRIGFHSQDTFQISSSRSMLVSLEVFIYLFLRLKTMFKQKYLLAEHVF